MKQFSLGVTYWPRRRRSAEGPLCTWADADHGALRAELGHIAELGFDTVRFELRWAEALPGPRISTAALGALERALDGAHARGLRAVVSTLGGSLGGMLHLPEWAVGYRLWGDALRARRLGPPVIVVRADQPAILAGERYLREPARDLYGEPELLEAQRTLLRELVGNLGAHPAAAAWQFGADLEDVRRPGSARAAAAWWSELAARARELGARTTFGAVSPMGLRRPDGLRPDAIVAAGAGLALSAAPLPASARTYPRSVSFAHALAAAMLRSEGHGAAGITIADLGAATAVAGGPREVAGELLGRPMAIELVEAERQATILEETLGALRREGAAGVWLARYADLSPDLWSIAPADRSWWARTAGLVAADGREKPAAAAVARFAATLRAGALPAPEGPPALPFDPERYWRDPAAAFRELWEDWQKG